MVEIRLSKMSIAKFDGAEFTHSKIRRWPAAEMFPCKMFLRKIQWSQLRGADLLCVSSQLPSYYLRNETLLLFLPTKCIFPYKL